MNRLRAYATRYHFNLTLKITVTVLFIAWLFLLCIDTPYKHSYSWQNQSTQSGEIFSKDGGRESISIAETAGKCWIWRWNIGVEAPVYIANLLVVSACVLSLIFLWLNRPCRTIFYSVYTLIVTCLLDARLCNYNTDRSGTFYYNAFLSEYYEESLIYYDQTYIFIWIVTLLIVGLSITTVVLGLSKQKQPTAQYSPASLYDQLRQYKQLLDEGVISEEDFEQKKQQLLK